MMAGPQQPEVDHCGSCPNCQLMASLSRLGHEGGTAPASVALPLANLAPLKPADDRRYLAWMETVQRELAEERKVPPKKPECVLQALLVWKRGSCDVEG
jgi:hypothetical protein